MNLTDMFFKEIKVLPFLFLVKIPPESEACWFAGETFKYCFISAVSLSVQLSHVSVVKLSNFAENFIYMHQHFAYLVEYQQKFPQAENVVGRKVNL